MKITLKNRDGATLWLEKIRDVENNISEWKLCVDEKHDWVLQYIRCIGYPEIKAIDPSGGPYISLADEFLSEDNRYYKVVKITDCTILWLSERNNN